jgi:N12 class adenine-specific DNA methylase
MGTVKFWKKGGRAAKMVAECGCGKTLMAIAACFVHAAGKRFTAIAMCPPHLPKKWAREVFMTLPNVRVFIVYDMRNNGDVHKPHGMTESNDKREVLCP